VIKDPGSLTTPQPPRQHHDHQEISTSDHTKDLVIIVNGKAKEENGHKEKG